MLITFHKVSSLPNYSFIVRYTHCVPVVHLLPFPDASSLPREAACPQQRSSSASQGAEAATAASNRRGPLAAGSSEWVVEARPVPSLLLLRVLGGQEARGRRAVRAASLLFQGARVFQGQLRLVLPLSSVS